MNISKIYIVQTVSDFQIDVWSFGVLIWELLLAIRPYEGFKQNQIIHLALSGLVTVRKNFDFLFEILN